MLSSVTGLMVCVELCMGSPSTSLHYEFITGWMEGESALIFLTLAIIPPCSHQVTPDISSSSLPDCSLTCQRWTKFRLVISHATMSLTLFPSSINIGLPSCLPSTYLCMLKVCKIGIGESDVWYYGGINK